MTSYVTMFSRNFLKIDKDTGRTCDTKPSAVNKAVKEV